MVMVVVVVIMMKRCKSDGGIIKSTYKFCCYYFIEFSSFFVIFYPKNIEIFDIFFDIFPTKIFIKNPRHGFLVNELGNISKQKSS